MAKKKSKDKTNMYLLTIVAIVGLVGIVVLVMNTNSTESDYAGQVVMGAFQKTTTDNTIDTGSTTTAADSEASESENNLGIKITSLSKDSEIWLYTLYDDVTDYSYLFYSGISFATDMGAICAEDSPYTVSSDSSCNSHSRGEMYLDQDSTPSSNSFGYVMCCQGGINGKSGSVIV